MMHEYILWYLLIGVILANVSDYAYKKKENKALPMISYIVLFIAWPLILIAALVVLIRNGGKLPS